MPFVHSFQPPRQQGQEQLDLNAVKVFRTAGQVAQRPLHYRAPADSVARRKMMERYCRLHESLIKLLVLRRRGAPHILEHFMRFVKFAAIE